MQNTQNQNKIKARKKETDIELSLLLAMEKDLLKKIEKKTKKNLPMNEKAQE